MVTVYRDVEVKIDIDLDDFDDDDVVREVKARGYLVGEEPEIISIEEYWNQGNRKEALILLEREFPELIGISKLLD